MTAATDADIREIKSAIESQYGSVKQISLAVLVCVGRLCITSGDFSRWLTEPYWIESNTKAIADLVTSVSGLREEI